MMFDLDTPGHYMRLIRSVSITIPCTTGTYASLNCTLTLTKSSLRVSPLPGDGYPRQGSEDSRFVDYFQRHPVHRHEQCAERQRALRGQPGRHPVFSSSRAPMPKASGRWTCPPSSAKSTIDVVRD